MPTKNYKNNILWIIFNNKKQILLWKYNSSKPNWTFPKWWILENEDYETAIFREIYEEIWLKNSCFEIVYVYEKSFVKDFSLEEIKWKIENKLEYFTWKKEKIIVLNFKWEEKDIDLSISNELSEYRFVEIEEISSYISDENLIDFIWIDFLKTIIF